MITDQDIREATMYVNGVDIFQAVGALVDNYKVGATAITNEAYQGKDSTDFNVLSTIRGMRTITVTLFYKAKDQHGLALKKSEIDNLLGRGKLDLYLPDRFHYAAYLTAAGEEALLGVEGQEMIATSTYTFQGIRHGDLQTLSLTSGDTFLCESLIPLTDCKITVPAAGATGNYVIASTNGGGSVTVNSVGVHDTIVIDGIQKRILQNGAPCSGNMSFISFPKLAPGENTITVYYGGTYRTKSITVEYYPTY